MTRVAAVMVLVTVLAVSVSAWWLIATWLGWRVLAVAVAATVLLSWRTGRAARQLARDLDEGDRWTP